MNKFVDGPWEVIEVGGVFDINARLGTVVTAYGIDNANLIAAAPDMYAAIQDALGDYEAGEPIREYELRNALIKARGET